MRTLSLPIAALLAIGGCSGENPPGNEAGTGGFQTTGGTGQDIVGSGGFVASGGFAATGGLVGAGGLVGSGGAVSTGGVLGTGGEFATGGIVGTGGVGATGGVMNTGGSVGTGGVMNTGGSVGTGGVTGACTNVRPTGTEWDEATCAQWASQTSECGNAWMVNNNYCNESCGRCSSGGTGGAAGSGGASGTGGGGNSCNQADSQVCNNQIGTHCGYTYEYWKDQGTGCQTNTDDGFSVTWNNINNLLGRKGLRPGSKTQIVDYSANYNPNGNSYLCVYGWTRGPLIEYYIVDSWGNWRPPGSGYMGQVQTDGGTYDIYRTERVNQPSIDGNTTFYQYWSVRTQKRTSGTITVANHFNAWAALGMNLGNLYEVSMTVEGYQSSGTADVQFSMR